MEAVPVKFVPRGFGETYRRDWWWVEPMIVFTVFGSFIVYATWAAFQNAHYTFGPYLSPFYSPELFGDSPHAIFGPKPQWWPALLPFSPALLILQNVHRYFAYIACLFLLVLSYDVWLALWFPNPATGQTEFGIGVGTLLLAVNVVLLSSYTLGCHSIRHVVGGLKDEVSKSPVRSACYNCSSALNGRHMLFAWMSLFSVALADLYVRLCSMGILTDVRLF